MAHMEVPTVTDKVLFLEINVVNFEERRKQEGLTNIAPKCQKKYFLTYHTQNVNVIAQKTRLVHAI
jgi:hypothetical protein